MFSLMVYHSYCVFHHFPVECCRLQGYYTNKLSFPGASSNHVTIKALLELHNSADCLKSTEQISLFSLNLALAAEYIINLINNNDTALGIPGITYGKSAPTYLCVIKGFLVSGLTIIGYQASCCCLHVYDEYTSL